MSERNRLVNGRFLHDLDSWVAMDASYSAGDGDAHYGVAVLATGGGAIAQEFSVARLRVYSLHLAVKAAIDLSAGNVTARIEDGDGDVVTERSLQGVADTWTATTITVGLAPGTTYTLTITNHDTGRDVKVDDVWLWYVPMTRAEVADRVATKLGRLARQRDLSTAQDADATEGDYTYAVDAGLRALRAINPQTGTVDVRYVDPWDVDALLDAVEREMLEQLRRDYAVETDIDLGPRRERRSQISEALGEITAGSGSSGGGGESRRVQVRGLGHE